jgi:DNA (cytosine-5)-methyltransferase 1
VGVAKLRPSKAGFAAVDLFCGAGGLTCGFRQAGIAVTAGVDLDPTSRFPFETNNQGSRFVEKDVAQLSGADVQSWYPTESIRILAGCAPCQPFSKYTVRQGRDDRWRLLQDFLRLVEEVRPDVVSMENVPDLRRHRAYPNFLKGLSAAGYLVNEYVVRSADYGVPQTRERLVILAGSKGKSITLIDPPGNPMRNVRDVIGELPAIRAGQQAATDPLHIACRLSSTNLERIRATPEGGGWRDWPKSLRLKCHGKRSGRWYVSVYGRMAWDDLAPTVTTQCFGYGNGRFGHPEQDRAISLREAALLQTFPADYEFTPPDEVPRFTHVGRHIGNAVPVALAKAIGASIIRSWNS